MGVEIEAKVKVTELKSVAEKLKNLKAEYADTVHQQDTFFSDVDRKLIESGCGLRIRRQSGIKEERAFVTFKGPKEAGPYKIRSELEVEITEAETMEAIFHGLGYERLLAVEKTRQIWHYDGCEVGLDDVVFLGTFVEVEGPDVETVRHVMEQIGLGGYESIREGYAGMVRKQLEKTDSGKTEAVFDDE
ncbi:MAG: class IV adenylate cyclase [Sedimentisphaerales bacterium]|nr:class IV adenylate cyclase [Sedimentisphaerales bacterium]